MNEYTFFVLKWEIHNMHSGDRHGLPQSAPRIMKWQPLALHLNTSAFPAAYNSDIFNFLWRKPLAVSVALTMSLRM